MVLSSFSSRQWDPVRLAAVPPSFVLHTLLPAAGQAHLWRGEGAEELQQGVAAWVGRYAAALAPMERRRQLLLALLGLLAGGGSGAPAQQRPLVQTLMGALEAAAQSQSEAAAAGAGAAAGSQDEERQWQLLLLQRLQEVTRQLNTAWGAGGPTGSFATSVCSSLLRLAASTGPLLPDSSGSSQAVFAAAAAWLQQLPLPLLLPGGQLHRGLPVPVLFYMVAASMWSMLAAAASARSCAQSKQRGRDGLRSGNPTQTSGCHLCAGSGSNYKFAPRRARAWRQVSSDRALRSIRKYVCKGADNGVANRKEWPPLTLRRARTRVCRKAMSLE